MLLFRRNEFLKIALNELQNLIQHALIPLIEQHR